MNQNTDYAELCEGIAEIIDNYGIHHGTYGDQDVGYCLLGAGFRTILGDEAAVIDYQSWRGVGAKITEALGFLLPNKVTEFNDGRVEFDSERDRVVFPEGISKETAVDFAMERAKHWRNLG